MMVKYTNLENASVELDLNNSQSFIILGANGSGKSSFGRKIKNDLIGDCLRIPSQKDLFIPKSFTIADEDSSSKNIGKTRTSDGKRNFANNSAQGNNEMIDDFSEVITTLISNHMSVFTKFGENVKNTGIKDEGVPESKFEKVSSIFSRVFCGYKLEIDKQKLKINNYDLDDISDGERSAIYLISKCVLDDDAKLIIVDEPESHLNSALLNELWDLIEAEKKEVRFIYLTHNIEFFDYKNNAQRYWIKDFDYSGKKWNIEKINGLNIPNDLVIRIIGVKKKKILFCEGNTQTGTRDYELYRYLYPEFTVIPVSSGSCYDVIKYVKALRNSGQVYNKEYFGLIDRDFRSDESVLNDEKDGIFSLPTAIYESLFLREEIINLFTNNLEVEKDKFVKDLKERYSSNDFLNAQNRNKIHIETSKKREELKNSTDKEPVVVIQVLLDWSVKEDESYNEMLKKFKSKDIKNVYKYTDVVNFVKKEIIDNKSRVFEEVSGFMPVIK
jgi:ABC-type dipeptide/oligopeptide/nickel transport system ATPase component